MEKFDFKSFDGRVLSAYKSVAKNEKAVVQFIHGASDRIERYKNFMDHLNNNDISFYAFDNRAHGESEIQGGPYVYLQEGDDKNIVKDALAFSDYISEQTKKPLFLIGHSMGSFIARNVAFHTDKYKAYIYVGSGIQKKAMLKLQKKLLDSIIKVKGWDFFSKKISAIGMESLSSDMIKKNKIVIPIEWLSTDEEMLKEDIKDVQLNKSFTVGSYRVLSNLIHNSQMASNIKMIDDKVVHVFISGTEDPVGNYGKGVRKLANIYNKLSDARIKLILFDGMRHEVLRERDRIKVFDKICDIISSID